MIHLSKRMEAIVNMVTIGNKICDVGCDHGYVSIALVERNIAPSALAMDINEGPLEHAKENIDSIGLHNQVSTRLSNGLREYHEGEADSLIIAGMGGPLMQDILSYDWKLTQSFKEYIFSPQSEIKEFRGFVDDNGFQIVDEDMVLEDGKYYVVMKCIRGSTNDNKAKSVELGQSFGPMLLAKKHPILKLYLDNEKKKKEDILCKLKEHVALNESLNSRIEEVQMELDLINQALIEIHTS